MNRTKTRRSGAETDIFLMVGCSVSKTVFLFLIIFTYLTATDKQTEFVEFVDSTPPVGRVEWKVTYLFEVVNCLGGSPILWDIFPKSPEEGDIGKLTNEPGTIDIYIPSSQIPGWIRYKHCKNFKTVLTKIWIVENVFLSGKGIR